MTTPQPEGTEELEKGLLPQPAITFVPIAAIAVTMLLVFNSQALLDWTRQPQPGPVIARLEGPATTWHGWMTRIGAAPLFDAVKAALKVGDGR